MIYPVAPEGPPQYVWISARRGQEIRSACAWLGAGFVFASLFFGTMIIMLGARLPTAYHPFNGGVLIAGGVSAFCLLLSAISAAGSRPYVRGEYLNLTGARTARRVLGALWAGATFCSGLALLILVMTVGSSLRTPDPDVRYTAGIWSYMLLLALPSVLTGVAFFVGRGLFRAPAQTEQSG